MQEVLQWLICAANAYMIDAICLLSKKNTAATEMTMNLWTAIFKITKSI